MGDCMSNNTPILRAFESAYPGSMFEKSHGDYIERDDSQSLAYALLEIIAERKRQKDDIAEAFEIVCQERDALKAQRDELLAALKWQHQFYLQDGEGPVDKFERIGETFHSETGYLRPGKDCVIHSMEDRQAAWDEWVASGIKRTHEAITKAEQSFDAAQPTGKSQPLG